MSDTARHTARSEYAGRKRRATRATAAAPELIGHQPVTMPRQRLAQGASTVAYAARAASASGCYSRRSLVIATTPGACECSGFLRSVMRRAIDDAPTILLSASRIGDTVMDTSMRRPFFFTPTVS